MMASTSHNKRSGTTRSKDAAVDRLRGLVAGQAEHEEHTGPSIASSGRKGAQRRSMPSKINSRSAPTEDTRDRSRTEDVTEVRPTRSLQPEPVTQSGPTANETSNDVVEWASWPQERLTGYGRLAELLDQFLVEQAQLKSDHATGLAMFTNVVEQSFALLESKHEISPDDFRTDIEDFQNQMETMFKRHQSVGKIAYKLGEMLPALLTPFFEGDQRKRRRTTLESPSLDPSIGYRSPSADLDPLEEAYYDKRGAVRQARDEIFNHLSERGQLLEEQPVIHSTQIRHHASNRSTEFVSSGGQQSETLAQWISEHEEMVRDKREMEEDLKQLWEQCRDAGFDVGPMDALSEAGRTASMAEDQDVVDLALPAFLNVDSDTTPARFFKERRWPAKGALVAPITQSTHDQAENQQFIQRWQTSITDSAPSPEMATLSSTVTTPKDDAK